MDIVEQLRDPMIDFGYGVRLLLFEELEKLREGRLRRARCNLRADRVRACQWPSVRWRLQIASRCRCDQSTGV
jgi:hypothetical protein